MATKFRLFGVGFVVAALLLGCISATQASVVPILIGFDPSGTGNFTPNVQFLDWEPGNALAVSGNTAIQVGGVGATFDLFYQAGLGIYKDSGGVSYSAAGKDITIVAGFTEIVTAVPAAAPPLGTANFSLAPGATNAWLEVYVGGTPFGNLAGVGFGSDGGALKILDATIYSSEGTFTVLTGVSNLDMTGDGDQYPAIDSVRGIGATDINARVNSFNPLYFDFGPAAPGIVNLTLFNSSQVLPFNQVNPSAAFVTSQGAASTTAGAGSGVGSLGSVNGGALSGPAPNGGPDVQLQVDGNQSFQQIPEPASVAVWLIGLAIGGAAWLTRQQATSVASRK